VEPSFGLTAPDEEIRFCPACGTAVVRREVFGRSRPVCPACGRVHFVDPKVAAAVLLVREGRVLLVRRVNAPEQGKWSLPAGFVDADEDPRQAAERECAEETGLQVRAGDLLDVIAGREHAAGASIVLVYRGEIQDGEAHPGDDADQVGFFAPHELPPLAFAATRRALERWQAGGYTASPVAGQRASPPD
jgi:ADP-ribose pyrophosphatase YjhB (NUDIX family)